MNHFRTYTKETVLQITKTRRFETRIGERIKVPAAGQDINQFLDACNSRFVLLGIPEDIGVRANLGIGGTDSVWVPFLSAFLNTQSNDYFDADNLALLGDFDFGDLLFLIENSSMNPEERIEAYRSAVNTIDEEVEKIIKAIAIRNKIPIVIGGGHNNAYPIIRGVAKGLHQSHSIPAASIHCINLDAHTDYRIPEGRHSGNPFRYAQNNGYLKNYMAIGVHENYIPQSVITDMYNNPHTRYITFEDIQVREKLNFNQALASAIGFTEDLPTGIELDLDCITNVLSSAETPSGFSTTEARRYLHTLGMVATPAYLHICEGAVQLNNGRKNSTTGKLISYLVSDFVKAMNG
jgi:formiminoglutamase